MSLIEEALTKRLILVEKIQTAFYDLFPGSKAKLHMHRGRVQRQIFAKLSIPASHFNQALVNEVLSDIGYRKCFLRGVSYYKKTERFKAPGVM